ncbi:MAG: ATP-binding protein, partial [Gammaproteobacteria bacterium]|nr:ATP-binding protein [Gammaproteobacteria bacterium]
AQEATPEEGWVKVKLNQDGDFAIIEIEDNGCGMDKKFIQERLFKPFDTTKGNAGMGIGVYESKEFITSLDGDIIVSSELGKGTLFTLKIPVLKRDSIG